MAVLCLVLVCYAALSSFAIVLMGKRELVALLNYLPVSVLWLFLIVSCVSLQCVVVVFPEQLSKQKRKILLYENCDIS